MIDKKMGGFGFCDYKKEHVDVGFYLNQNGKYYARIGAIQSAEFNSLNEISPDGGYLYWKAVDEVEKTRRELGV